jgi:zinc protease
MASPSASHVVKTQLNNGLGVILREDHSAPVVSLWTWYRVGSRNEQPGKTGLSHWVEHMQFKGTENIAKGQIFRDVSRVGGTLNALTSHDWTAYFETVPSHQIDLPLRIESDRMVGSLFTPDEVESERTVILSERQGAENNPGYALYEEVVGAAFHAHPYRHMVIGYECDLRTISRDDLIQHYRRFYHPSNAFVVAVGAFDSGDLLGRLEKLFEPVPGGMAIPRSISVMEPPQPGERRVLLRRPSGVPYLRVAYHAPGAADADAVPLLVTEAILSGGQPMGLAGGSAMGRSSRLYRALVAAGLARSAGSDMSLTIDPFLFQIGVTGLPGSDLSQLERVVDDEVTRLRNELVPENELQRAVRQLEAQFVYSSEGMTNQAYWLGHWEIVDSWNRAATLPDEIRRVTAEDIRRVARQHLLQERRTVGWLEPVVNEMAIPGSPGVAGQHFAPPAAWGLTGPHSAAGAERSPFLRAVLPNGVPVLGQERPQSQSFALRLRVPAGAVYERH